MRANTIRGRRRWTTRVLRARASRALTRHRRTLLLMLALAKAAAPFLVVLGVAQDGGSPQGRRPAGAGLARPEHAPPRHLARDRRERGRAALAVRRHAGFSRPTQRLDEIAAPKQRPASTASSSPMRTSATTPA
jgi:hypothetical protein